MSSRCLCENYFGTIMPPTHRFKSLFGCGATPDGAWTVRGKIRNDMMTVIALKEPAWLCVVCVAVYCHMGAVWVCLWATLVCVVFGSLAVEETTEVVQSKELICSEVKLSAKNNENCPLQSGLCCFFKSQMQFSSCSSPLYNQSALHLQIMLLLLGCWILGLHVSMGCILKILHFIFKSLHKGTQCGTILSVLVLKSLKMY